MTPDFKMIRTGAGAAPAVLLLGMLPVFGAAQIDSGDSRAGAEITLEEIVVTARKRTEDLQSTPISIRAFSGEDLEARGVDRMDDLANYVPNMTFQNSPGHSGSNSAAAVYVRGIGQQDFVPTVDPGVGIYIDGVYVARSLGAVLDVLDIERIEVLRGPQGTLFGRNTTGGAINIITQAPGDAFAGGVDVKLGSDQRQDVRLSGNLPLSDNSGVRFSVARLSQDGYVHRMADDVSLGDDDTLTGRLRFYGELTDRLSLDFSVDFSPRSRKRTAHGTHRHRLRVVLLQPGRRERQFRSRSHRQADRGPRNQLAHAGRQLRAAAQLDSGHRAAPVRHHQRRRLPHADSRPAFQRRRQSRAIRLVTTRNTYWAMAAMPARRARFPTWRRRAMR